MNTKKISLLLFIVLNCIFALQKLDAQIALEFNDTTLCPTQPLLMCAAFTGQADPLNTDDKHTGVIDIGFDFVFFGNTYNQCVISDNGYLSFNSNKGGDHSSYTWTGLNTSGDVNNAIHAAMVDMYLPASGEIKYQYFGTPGDRRFIAEWCNLGLYGCHQLKVTTQIILYEGSNNIEIHTTHIDPIVGNCPSASGGSYGLVVQGVRNTTGNLEFYTPGREPTGNWGTQGADDDGVRYTPNGSSVYMIEEIPFNPWIIIDEDNSEFLNWYAEGQPNVPIATGACASVNIDKNISYYTVRYAGFAGCLNEQEVDFIDTVFIHLGSVFDTTDVEICEGETYEFLDQILFEEGQYNFEFQNELGCDSILTLNLRINPLPNVTLIGSQRVEICEGSTYSFELNNPENTTTYQWKRDGNEIPGETGAKITTNLSGRYYVEAVTDKGCERRSESFELIVNPNPVAEIKMPEMGILCAYDTLTLNAEPGANYNYYWTPEKAFRVVSGAEYEEVQGVFLVPETQVELTVFNEFGCSDKDSIIVYTKPCCDVFVPNAFTPDNDGINDYFKPHLQNGQVLISMMVFDRYGKKLYDNDSPEKGWDGKYPNGKDAKVDTYMYHIQYTCSDGKVYTKKESLTLVR